MIRHHLKDGTILTDIRGHVVKREDVPLAYAIIDRMNDDRERMRSHEENSERNS